MESQKKLQKTYLLKYKLLFEETKCTKFEHSQGAVDLAAHLNEFRKKLSKEDTSQIKKFDDAFFPRVENEISFAVNDSVEGKDIESSSEKNSNVKPLWFKKLFREVAFMTHPDKIGKFPIKAIVEKYKSFYLVATTAYEKDKYSDMLMIGDELDLDLPSDEIEKYIVPSIINLSKQIEDMKNDAGYQWYHVSEDQKEMLLSNYLKQLGFVFSQDEIKEVISRKSKRKVGQRPVKINKRRLK